jgi:serine/threonine-protein kinase
MDGLSAAIAATETQSVRTDLLDLPCVLGKYEIRRELGRGTCGIVYHGFDPFVRREVAIKIGWRDGKKDPLVDLSEVDFFNEAHAAGRLQHPNIVAVYDAHHERDLRYIVMEYINGETLLEFCRKEGKRLPAQKIVECMFKCCLALDFSHRMGVIHRDIKPSNIMLNQEGETKLLDFSVAQVQQDNPITPSMIVGSPSYMPPEQITQGRVGSHSDLYSLAAVMYQLLTGNLLFKCDDIRKAFEEIVHKAPPRLKDSRPDLPEELSEIIDKALKKNPTERFRHGKEMAAALAHVYDRLVHAEYSIDESQKHFVLKKFKFFADFGEEHLNELMTVSTLLNCESGKVIRQEGDIDNSFYLVVEGSADVMKGDKCLVRLHQGDCFGEVISLAANKRMTTLRTTTGVIILKVDAVRIGTLPLRSQMLFYKAFAENLINRLSSH